MKRLTTDKPSNNTETMLNYAYAKDGYVHLSYADGEEDIRLTEYLCRVAHEIGCEFATEENILNGDTCLECDCKVSILNVLAIQAAELRERLKKYEDAEEQGLLVRLPCKVGEYEPMQRPPDKFDSGDSRLMEWLRKNGISVEVTDA